MVVDVVDVDGLDELDDEEEEDVDVELAVDVVVVCAVVWSIPHVVELLEVAVVVWYVTL